MAQPHEDYNRLLKAIKLIDVMRVNGWDAEEFVARMKDDHWNVVASLAGVKPPSRTCQQVVKDRLHESRRIALAAAC